MVILLHSESETRDTVHRLALSVATQVGLVVILVSVVENNTTSLSTSRKSTEPEALIPKEVERKVKARKKTLMNCSLTLTTNENINSLPNELNKFETKLKRFYMNLFISNLQGSAYI
jgi:hypothetical protein